MTKIDCYVLSSTVAFVRVTANIWIKTHGCVGRVACGHCGVPIGVACKRADGQPGGATHYVRRGAAAKLGPINTTTVTMSVSVKEK